MFTLKNTLSFLIVIADPSKEYIYIKMNVQADQIIQGDCLEIMQTFPTGSIDMCLTSPPYWGLRDYGVEQVFGGKEDCKHEWNIKNKKVRDGTSGAGTRWQHREAHNIGPDEYDITKCREGEKKIIKEGFCQKCNAWKGQLGLEPTPELYIEHMIQIFHEVKRMLKKEGTLWLNMGDTYGGSGMGLSYAGKTCGPKSILKGKLDKFPSVGHSRGQMDKCLLMVPERLAWSLIRDGWILRNKIIWHKPNGMPSSARDRFTNKWEYVFMFSQSKKYYFDLDAVREEHLYPEDVQRRMRQDAEAGVKPFKKGTMDARHRKGLNIPGQDPHGIHRKRHSGYYGADGEYLVNPLGKNPGDVFEIPTQPFPEAHFAVFPEKLCEKPIKAGCPKNGIVLDPFCGAGTACLVAKQLGRHYIGIDISGKFCDMSRKRIGEWLF